MRKMSLSVALALSFLALSAVVASAQRGQRGTRGQEQVTFTPSEPGNIFTVINYARAQGQAQATVVTLTDGTTLQSRTVAPPYQSCRDTTPAGFVIKMRNPRPSSDPLTLSTNGTIVRGPYVGERPAEALHPCYRSVTF